MEDCVAVRYEQRASQVGTHVDPNAPVGSSLNPSNEVFTISNFITLTRLLLTFVFLFLFVTHANRLLSLAIYAIAASTDWIDGLVARSTNTVTWLGKSLDPAVDRALLLFGVIGLVARGELPMWMALILVLRDVYLGIGARILLDYREHPLDVLFLGKVTTACLMFGYCDMLLDWPQIQGLGLVDVDWLPLLNHESAALGLIFVYIGIVLSVTTAIIYTKEGIQSIAEYRRMQAKDE